MNLIKQNIIRILSYLLIYNKYKITKIFLNIIK